MDLSDEGNPGQLTQLFFWGGHGGIGGGDSRQEVCSSITINFLIEEMEKRELGLAIDKSQLPEPGDVESDIGDVSSSAVMSFIEKLTGKHVRTIPSIEKVHPSVIKRYQSVSSWRPAALEPLEEELMNAEV